MIFLHPVSLFIIQSNDQVYVVDSVRGIWVRECGYSRELLSYLIRFLDVCETSDVNLGFYPPLVRYMELEH